MTIRWYTHDMEGAPTLSGTVGALITVLDAILVNGFTAKTLTSLSVSSGVATANFSGGHNFKDYSLVTIAGATPSGLNGEKRITSVDANNFTFDTTEGDGSATGTITAKVTGGNWTKAFSGTNKAAYLPGDPASLGFYLRVEDGNHSQGARQANWHGYENMTGVDTGTNPFPTAAQQANGMSIMKSSVADSSARHWTAVTDGKTLYFFPYHFPPSSDSGDILGFVQLNPFNSADNYSMMIWGHHGSAGGNLAYGPAYQANGVDFQYVTATLNGHYMARSYSGAAGAVAAQKSGTLHYTNTNALSLVIGDLTYPHPGDNGLYICPISVGELNAMRGIMPGLYQHGHNSHPFTKNQIISNAAGLSGRKLLAVRLSAGWQSTNNGTAYVDLTGPW